MVRCITGDTMSDKQLEEIHLPSAPLVPLVRHTTEPIMRYLSSPRGGTLHCLNIPTVYIALSVFYCLNSFNLLSQLQPP